MNKWRKSRKGFTLVEVLITLSIMAIVMTVILTLFNSGTKSMSVGQTKASLQSDLRLSLEMMQNEVRYARDLTLIKMDQEPTFSDADDRYLYFYEGKITLSVYDQIEKKVVTTVFPGNYENMDIFVYSEDQGSVLGLQLKSQDGDLDYELTTKVKLLNMAQKGTKISLEINRLTSKAIRFKE